MIGVLSDTIGRWLLKRRYVRVNRDVEALNITQMQNAVLVFHLTDEKTYTDILKISTTLNRDEGIKEITLLAFNPNKEIPRYVDDQNVIIFGDKELDLFGIPKTDFALELLREKFDLLLDFTPCALLPTDYFLALLYAKTKVGRAEDDKGYVFDLIIDIPIESTILDLSKNMIRYIKMINRV